MPELPEVETIRIGLLRSLVGRSIVDVQIGDFAGVIEDLTVDQLRDAVNGRSITGLRRRGKYLLVDLTGDLTLIVHLRMTGQLLVLDRDAPAERFEHIRFLLDDDHDLRFADQRKFGRFTLATPDGVGALDKKLGAEPLDATFTPEALGVLMAGRKAMVKAMLLDQHVIAGVGNIYADEALYRSRIHPMRQAMTLSSAEVQALHHELQAVLRGSIDRRGTSFSSYRDSEGRSGENQHALLVYGQGRNQTPCPRCGTMLSCILVAGRSSHICPGCQVLEPST